MKMLVLAMALLAATMFFSGCDDDPRRQTGPGPSRGRHHGRY